MGTVGEEDEDEEDEDDDDKEDELSLATGEEKLQLSSCAAVRTNKSLWWSCE